MKRCYLFLLILTILLLSSQSGFSEAFTQHDAVWLTVYFDIQKEKMRVEKRIQEVNSNILTNQQTIREINKLLTNIEFAKFSDNEKRRKDALEAEPFAKKALLKAKETEKELQKQKTELEMEWKRLDEIERHHMDFYARKEYMNAIGFIKKCSGGVKVINPKTQTMDSCTLYSPLEEGNVVITSSDGKAELKILGERGYMVVGPNSELVVVKKTPEKEIMGLVEGKTYIQVEKAEKYKERIKNLIENYKEDLKSIKGWADEEIEKMKKEIKKELRELQIHLCKKIDPLKCQRPIISGSVRGTEFIVEKGEDFIGKVSVIEGEVDVEIPSTSEKFVIPQGYTIIINADGTIKKERINSIDELMKGLR